MSSVNYSLKHKGVRLISSEEACSKTNNGKYKLNTKEYFLKEKKDLNFQVQININKISG